MSGHDDHAGGHDSHGGGHDDHSSHGSGGHDSHGGGHGGGHGGDHGKGGGGLFGMFAKKKHKEPSADEIKHHLHELEAEYKEKIKVETKGDTVLARLHEYGFAHPSKDKKGKITGWSGQEEFEKFQHRIVKTEFPQPNRRFRLVLEYPNFNVENTYYWFLRYYNETWGFDDVKKVIDTNAASVASSSFGNLQTRIGAQQNQASQYLKGVSEMIKGLFQIVREVRVIDERLQYYRDSDGDKGGIPENALSSEIVLKGLWIDQVEGGAKNPGSVYGLAQTIGFTILPDLFFRIKIRNRTTLEKDIDSLKFNEKVKEVLKRKLRQYYEWKWRTKKELLTRRDFEIKYMKQHYDTIKLYMAWTKPYLRNVRRLTLYERNMDNPHIMHSFEAQITEMETLFIRDDFGADGKSDHSAAVLSLHIFHRVRPELSMHTPDYQHKGPILAGMADITIRAYTWDHHQIENYIKYRQDDDLDLLSSIDKSVEAAMNALGDDLKRYLMEADSSLYFGDVAKGHGHGHDDHGGGDSIFTPFLSIFKGFGELFGSFGGNQPKKKKKEKGPDAKAIFKGEKVHHRAHHFADEACFEGYLRYKMGPGGNVYWIDPG